MQINPYLTFNNQAKDAVDFYVSCLGGEITDHMKFSDMPKQDQGDLPPEKLELTAHIAARLGDQMIMASDHPWGPAPTLSGFSVQTEWNTIEEAEQAYTKLSEGGEIIMPFGPTSWSPGCGMFKDKFGVQWITNYSGK